jgi:signal peptidase II
VPSIILTILIIIADQWSKHIIEANMMPGLSLPVIPNIFHITYILNPGAAFGILENQRGFFIAIAIAMLLAAIYFYPRIPAKYHMLRFGVCLLVGGASGNVIDRIKTGYVVDFFDLRVWPVFNIADIAIVSGVICVIIAMFRLSHKEDECI